MTYNKEAMVNLVDSTKAFHTFGQWVKHQRKALGLTQADLAQRVACSKSMINKIESNQRTPSKSIIELLALHLKIPPADYVRFVQMPRPNLLVEPEDYLSERGTGSAQIPPKNHKDFPIPLTPLIGREHDIATVCTTLQKSRIRLLTLTGPGGIGKTHLALHVAAALKDKFTDGVYFVSLAPVRKPALVLSTIVQALGLQSKGKQRDDELLINYLHEKATLLILDNFEQALPATKTIAQLLTFTTHLKVLVTSRAVLRLSFEHEFVVPPLNVPELNQTIDPNTLAQLPAVQLFVQRAQAVQTDFALTIENARSVAEICVRLDGLPLAITLAAARCKILSPHAILARLTDGAGSALGLLSGGTHDLPARHQTIRQTIDWSYNLLNKREQTLFRRLSVFVRGCSLNAIKSVYDNLKAESQTHLRVAQSIPVLDFAIGLIDKSLLQRGEGPDGEPRFYMAEILREYAFERLIANNELDMMRQQHAAHILLWVDSIMAKMHSAEQELCLKHLDADYENIRAALIWSCTSDIETALRLGSMLWQYWLIRGYFSEGRAWLANMLERSATVQSLPMRVYAHALNGAGLLASVQGDQQAAKVYLQESLRLFLELDDQMGKAWALNHLGQTLYLTGQQEQAIPMFEESLQIFRTLGADWHTAWVLINLGEASLQKEETDHALQFFSEAHQLFSAFEYKRGIAAAIDRLARLAQLRRDSNRAKALFLESCQLFDEIGDRGGYSWALHHLGRIAYEDQQNNQAIGYLIESLRLFNKSNDRWGFAWSLLRLAQVISDIDQPQHAAKLFGAADAMIMDFNDRMSAAEREFVLKTLAEARTQAHANMWAKGKTLSSEKALAWILEQPFVPRSAAFQAALPQHIHPHFHQ